MRASKTRISRHASVFLVLFLLLLSASLASIALGSVRISLSDLFGVLSGRIRTGTDYTLILQIRIPRTLACIGAGLGLSTSGLILQNVMNNSLASPNTIGVNSGAGFAVMLSMVFFPAAIASRSFFAFTGALISSLLIFGLAYLTDSSRITIILAGITVSAFLNAGISLIKILDSDLLININTFLIGSLSAMTYAQIFIPLVMIVTAFLITALLSNGLNILSLGDDIASGLGMNVHRIRLIFLILSSLLAGAVISYAGLISFVGLIVPHIARRIFDSDNRLLLPASGLLGAVYVLFCDLLGRTLIAPYELPVGIIMSFIGGPFFLYLLLRKKGGRRLG